MIRFDWADPFLLDAQLSDDERMVRDSARDRPVDGEIDRRLDRGVRIKPDRIDRAQNAPVHVRQPRGVSRVARGGVGRALRGDRDAVDDGALPLCDSHGAHSFSSVQ